MEETPACPDFSELIHDVKIEIEEYGEDFVFLGVWRQESPAKETLTGFIFREDLDKKVDTEASDCLSSLEQSLVQCKT